MLAFAVLVVLGTWQLQRKTWKEGLIAALDERLAAPSAALPTSETWPALDPAHDEYRRVMFTAKFEKNEDALVYASASAFRPDVSGFGLWVFTPARLADGSVVVINRGFVPSDTNWKPNVVPSVPLSGDIAITGVMRWPERRGWFTPQDKGNVFFRPRSGGDRGGQRLGLGRPVLCEQELPAPAGGWPQPGKLVPNLSNNHLQYAVTWYGLALVLLGVFAAFALKSRRAAG